MAINVSPNVTTSGLVFAYDMNSQRSWKGAPTTNLVAAPHDPSVWTGNMFNNWINSTVTASPVVDPSGNMTASRMTGYYGRFTPNVSATTSTTYTFSVWLKNVSATLALRVHIAFGLNGTLVAYNNVTSVDTSAISNWTRFSITTTSPASGINQIQCGIDFGSAMSSNSGPYAVDMWGAQLEVGSFASPFVEGSRTSNTCVADIVTGSFLSTANLVYDSAGQASFSSNGYIRITSSAASVVGDITTEGWFNLSTAAGPHQTVICTDSDLWPGVKMLASYHGNALAWVSTDGATNYSISGPNVQNAGNTHMAFTRSAGSGSMSLYINGELYTTASSPAGNIYFNQSSNGYVGREYHSSTYGFNGKIFSTRIYNRVLSAVEIKQNFSAMRSRYGI